MSDDRTTDDAVTDDAPTDDAPTDDAVTGGPAPAPRRPSPSAQAAGRARRIGGRPVPSGRPAPAKATLAESVAESDASTRSGKAAKPTTLTKTGSAAKAPAAAASAQAGRAKRPPRAVAPAADAAALRRRLERLRWIPAGVLAAAVVVLAVLCFTLGKGVWWGTKTAAEVRGQVLAAAKTCTPTVSSYDYRNLAKARTDGLACSTGKFRSQFQRAMDTDIAKIAPQTKTIQTLQVTNAGIEQVSSDGKQWTLLVYGQHKVINTITGPTTPRLDALTIVVTMEKVGNKWLITNIPTPK